MRLHIDVLTLLGFLTCDGPSFARAQSYSLDGLKVPSSYSLESLYLFYVYTAEDAPGSGVGPDPHVDFFAEAHGHDLEGSPSIELSMVSYAHLWEAIDPTYFCCVPEWGGDTGCTNPKQLLIHSVDTGNRSVPQALTYSVTNPAKRSSQKVQATGMYILIVSNCGFEQPLTLGGNIVVHHSYGFLPGNEVWKMTLYKCLILAYFLLGLFWVLLSVRWWQQLFNVQIYIGIVVFLGILESGLWYATFIDWNAWGQRRQPLFVAAIMSTVFKSVFSFMLVVVAALGWGVTKPFLERKLILKVQCLAFLYICFDFLRYAVLSVRSGREHNLPFLVVMACVIPVSVMNGVIFMWVFSSLSNLMVTLSERQQTEKLWLFERFWMVLVATLFVATLLILSQFIILSYGMVSSWKWWWILTDLVPQLLYVADLMAIMYLWCPSATSKEYAFCEQVDTNDQETWVANTRLDDDPNLTIEHGGKSGFEPDVIGDVGRSGGKSPSGGNSP